MTLESIKLTTKIKLRQYISLLKLLNFDAEKIKCNLSILMSTVVTWAGPNVMLNFHWLVQM